MSTRAIVQVLLTGTKIFGRAFVEAYKVAAAEAAQSKANIKSDADEATKKTGITIDEACQILNVDKQAPIDKVIQRYQTLFEINDPKKGGSFYLQSKIFRAKERIEMELNQEVQQDDIEVKKEEVKKEEEKQN